MIIIVDVNIVISSLIRDSTTRDILVTSGQDFCFPELSLHKIRKYKDLILQKSGLSEKEFDAVFHAIFQFIRLIPTEELTHHWARAKRIMEHVDPEDVAFIASALSQENAIIWSDDRHFDQQKDITTLKTKDIAALFHKEKSQSF